MLNTTIPSASVLALAPTGWQAKVAFAAGQPDQLLVNNRAKIKKRITDAYTTQEIAAFRRAKIFPQPTGPIRG
ncbi:MAG TPA: hypothetical protein VGT44_04890 [Ktedonobacteraceae bacterium]|nr:hypothetical protein [Ktedonobacteraceae bacterium]